MLKMVDSIEFRMLPSSEFWLMNNNGGGGGGGGIYLPLSAPLL